MTDAPARIQTPEANPTLVAVKTIKRRKFRLAGWIDETGAGIEVEVLIETEQQKILPKAPE